MHLMSKSIAFVTVCLNRNRDFDDAGSTINGCWVMFHHIHYFCFVSDVNLTDCCYIKMYDTYYIT